METQWNRGSLQIPAQSLLVFNWMNQLNPDAPFSRAFYPDASDFSGAQPIHLADGQIENADIHLRRALTRIRKLNVRLVWSDLHPRDYYPPNVVVKASKGVTPYPHKISETSYVLNLLPDAGYTLHAEAYCRTRKSVRAQSTTITVAGNDRQGSAGPPALAAMPSDVMLTFQPTDCPKK
jgi:hypothetical protein